MTEASVKHSKQPATSDKVTLTRSLYATSGGANFIELDQITDVLIDNRAIGYRATSIGGRDVSFEPLAEIIAQYDLEQVMADTLMDGTVMTAVFAKLFPKRETFKIVQQTGILTMPMIVAAFRSAIGGDAPTKVVLSQIMAEILANSIRHLNLILPFDGLLSVSRHDAIFPSAATILEAARVKRITDVLESMKLDPEIGRVKTLSAASLYSALQPMFTRAGRMLIQTIEQDQYLEDTLLLLRLYVTHDPALPKTLVGNNDLMALATNLTYVLAAVSTELRDIVLPEYYLATAISDSALRLRELKRFSVKHISEVKQWYVHYDLIDHPGQQVVGLIFGRNMILENRPQVTVFSQVESSNNPLWNQTPFPTAENRLEPLMTQLFTRDLHCQSLASLASGVATYLHRPDDEAVVHFVNGATEVELLHYAAAVSRRTLLAIYEKNVFSLGFMNEDTELNFRSQSSILGSKVISADPAEAVIHSGSRENVGDGSVPCRIQSIPDTVRHQLLITKPSDLSVNLGAPFDVEVRVGKDLVLRCETTLSALLVLPSQLRLSLTDPIAARVVVSSFFRLMLELAGRADITSQTGEIARLRAATALSNMLMSMGASPAGRAITRSVFVKLLASVEPGEMRESVRGRLRHASVSYKVAMTTGARLLTALGLVPVEDTEAALRLIEAVELEKFMLGSVPTMSDLV